MEKDKDAVEKAWAMVREMVAVDSLALIQSSWAFQHKEEQRRRLSLVQELVMELVEVKKATNHATRLGEAAIESVICGMWRDVGYWGEFFLFEEEQASLRDRELRDREAPNWERFRTLLKKAVDTAPQVPKTP